MTSETFLYSAFGLSIQSELPLPELPPAIRAPDIFIRRGEVPVGSQPATHSEEFIFGSQSGAFRVTGGRDIVVDPLPTADNAAVRIVLLGRVMARLLWQRGWLPVHASGVAVNGEGILFAGSSGSGKSTMAAILHSRGHAIITDDVGAVRVSDNRCEVLPGWPRLRLSPDSMSTFQGLENSGTLEPGIFQVDKYSVNLGSQLPGPIPLRRIYFLDFGLNFSSEPLTLPFIVASLRSHSFLKRSDCDNHSAEAQLRICAAVAQSVTARRLVRPRSFEFLSELAQLVEEDLKAE